MIRPQDTSHMIYPIGVGLNPHLWDNTTTNPNHFYGLSNNTTQKKQPGLMWLETNLKCCSEKIHLTFRHEKVFLKKII